MKKRVLAIKLETQKEDEMVTKKYLVTYLTTENYIKKEYIEELDFVTRVEFKEFREEVGEFKDAVVVLFDDQRRQFERNIGVMIEEFKSEVRMLAEGLKMQIEASERRWNEQKEINNDVKKDISALKLKARLV